jgi:hypothetical protein
MNRKLFMDLVGNKFFTVTFTKQDGTKRIMNARLGVKKHLKGGNKLYDDAKFNYITVYDLTDKGYKTVNLNTIQSISTRGIKVTL